MHCLLWATKPLSSGDALLADNINGYGPERFVVKGAGVFPYSFQVHYFARGPMGYGMGQVEIVQYNGEGQILLESRSFVVMNDRANPDLGSLEKALE